MSVHRISNLAMQRLATALMALMCLIPTAHAAERRIALVIGNSAYQHAPLINPGNDARAVAQTLREVGFTVMERRNVNQTAMRRAVREFGDELEKGGIGLFYYAGHGMQVRGRNFLIPVGSDIQREDEVEDQAVDANLVLQKMASARNKLNIVILDACRNNPFASTFRSATVGLAAMDAPAGTIVAFSTAPGQVAADGSGDNGLYTKHLVSYVREPGLKVEDVFKRVRAAVRQESGGKQTPWENTSLEADFYFKLPDAKVVAAEEQERKQAQQAAIEKAVQEALKRSGQQAVQDKAKMEQEIAQRVAAERAAAERAAAERFAAMEKALQAALQAAARPTATPPAVAAVPSTPPAQVVATTPAAPIKTTPPARPATESGGSKTASAQQPVQVASAAPSATVIAASRAAVIPKVGDTWTYLLTERDYGNKKETRLRRTIDAVTDKDIRERAGDGSLLVYTHEGNLMRREFKNGEVRTWEPFLSRFTYPLEPGKTWEQKFLVRRPDRQTENEATNSVVGWETVTVPAGTFKALKISSVSQYRRKDNNFTGRYATNLWFAPEVRRWVKLETLDRGNNGIIYSDSTEELLSFNVK